MTSMDSATFLPSIIFKNTIFQLFLVLLFFFKLHSYPLKVDKEANKQS